MGSTILMSEEILPTSIARAFSLDLGDSFYESSDEYIRASSFSLSFLNSVMALVGLESEPASINYLKMSDESISP